MTSLAEGVRPDRGGQPQEIAIFPGAGSPRWSPTGTRVAFDASTAGHADIFVVGAQGTPRAQPLTNEQAQSHCGISERDRACIRPGVCDDA